MKSFEQPISLNTLPDLRGPIENRVAIGGIVRAGVEAIPHTDVTLEENKDTIKPSYDAPPEVRAALLERWEALKPERNSLTGIFIEEIWSGARRIRQEFAAQGTPAGLGRYVPVPNKAEYQLQPYETPNNTTTIEALKYATEDTLKEAAYRWETAHEARLRAIPREEYTGMDRAYKRFSDITNWGDRNFVTRTDGRPAKFITPGIGTAVETIWDVFGVASEVYEEQFGQTPTRDEMRQLFASTQPLTVLLAAGNMDLSVGFIDFLRQRDDSNRYTAREPQYFHSEFFEIEKVPASDGQPQSSLKLAIRPEALEAYAATLDHEPKDSRETTLTSMRTLTTGCPAVAAMGAGTETSRPKNVVAEMHAWCLEIAENYYLNEFPTHLTE